MENEAPGRSRVGDRESRRTGMDRFAHTLLDAGRGLVIFGVGVFFGIAGKLGIAFGIDDTYRYCFSGLCLLYGGWRIYRGYKKNYN
jgi:hypothetical protein